MKAVRDVCAVCLELTDCVFARLGHKRRATGLIPTRLVCANCAEAITAAWARAEGWQRAKKELENDDKH